MNKKERQVLLDCRVKLSQIHRLQPTVWDFAWLIRDIDVVLACYDKKVREDILVRLNAPDGMPKYKGENN